MKKAITLTLIAILFLGLFAGCNTYTRPTMHGTDGARVTRGFQYRHDGHVTNTGTARHARVNDGLRDGLRDGGTLHNFRYGGTGTGFDGMTDGRGVTDYSTGIDHGITHGTGFGTARGTVRSNTVRPALDGVSGTTAR